MVRIFFGNFINSTANFACNFRVAFLISTRIISIRLLTEEAEAEEQDQEEVVEVENHHRVDVTRASRRRTNTASVEWRVRV